MLLSLSRLAIFCTLLLFWLLFTSVCGRVWMRFFDSLSPSLLAPLSLSITTFTFLVPRMSSPQNRHSKPAYESTSFKAVALRSGPMWAVPGGNFNRKVEAGWPWSSNTPNGCVELCGYGLLRKGIISTMLGFLLVSSYYLASLPQLFLTHDTGIGFFFQPMSGFLVAQVAIVILDHIGPTSLSKTKLFRRYVHVGDLTHKILPIFASSMPDLEGLKP